jgi:dTDP-4-dehydrorhamnose 3,5-epimerase
MEKMITPLNDLNVLEPKVFKDERGYFFEGFNQQTFDKLGLPKYNWVQENESKSSRGVLRGLHFQMGDSAQAKLIRVIVGEVYDVVVDMRKDSSTFGKWYGTYLSAENKKQMLIPRGFAHGFLVTSEDAIFSYKCDNFYNPAMDSGVMYNDPEIGVEWPDLGMELNISAKDQVQKSFKDSYKF